MNTPDPAAEVREEIRAETTRVVRRWQQLPLDRARSHVQGAHDVVQVLADLAAERDGLRHQAVPNLGERVVMDQLQVMVYDLLQGEMAEPVLADTAARLTNLRRSLP